jgi:hypothetical protein
MKGIGSGEVYIGRGGRKLREAGRGEERGWEGKGGRGEGKCAVQKI